MTAAINKKLSASLNELTATEIVAAINAGTTTWTPGNHFLGSRSPTAGQDHPW